MTATPKPAPLPGGAEIPPFAIYRAVVAAWEDGTIKLLYTRLKGQGRKVLIDEIPGDEPVELGHKYQMVLQRIEEGEPVPPIETPEFPELPTPEVPVKPEPPIYKPEEPVKPEPPIYKPEEPVYKPVTPEVPGGIEPPVYEKPDKPDVPDRERPQPK